MVFKIVFGPAIEKVEPGILNSNLLPVNAKGDVLFLSVVSFAKVGSTLTPTSINILSLASYSSPFKIASKISVSWSPKNIETIAGGASAAPSLWSFPALATVILKRS